MNTKEHADFAELLSATMELYGAKLTPSAISLWTAALSEYPYSQVRAALSKHVQTPGSGRFAPKPADVIEALQGNDGRPSADEAWSLCPMSEAESAVWTSETAEAFFAAASDLLAAGETTAARMAFRQAYERIVQRARAERALVAWAVSLGHDPARREQAVRKALAAKRISVERAQRLLPSVALAEEYASIARADNLQLISGGRA